MLKLVSLVGWRRQLGSIHDLLWEPQVKITSSFLVFEHLQIGCVLNLSVVYFLLPIHVIILVVDPEGWLWVLDLINLLLIIVNVWLGDHVTHFAFVFFFVALALHLEHWLLINVFGGEHLRIIGCSLPSKVGMLTASHLGRLQYVQSVCLLLASSLNPAKISIVICHYGVIQFRTMLIVFLLFHPKIVIFNLF